MRKIILTLMALILPVLYSFCAEMAAPDEILEKYKVSFTYDGEAFDPAAWNPVREKIDNETFLVKYISPDGRLSLELICRMFSDFPVIELRPILECVGDVETGIVDDFKSLEYSHPCPSGSVRVRKTAGSMSRYSDFTRHDVVLQPRHECYGVSISQYEGRNSAWIPYIGVDYDAFNGVEIAIGWSGSFRADMYLNSSFNFSTGIDGGTHFKMLPGERFQMPYTVIYERSGKRTEDGLAEFHRFAIEHKAPRDSQGRICKPWLPLTASGGNKTDANMLKIMDKAVKSFKNIPFDVFWVDAGWYGETHEVPQETNCGPFWSRYVGNWHPNVWSHPDGNLRKVAKAAGKRGMKFLLWFEPERASIHAPNVKEHPEYYHRPKDDSRDEEFLLDLGNPEALSWITEEVSRNIRESGVQIYRQDFNMDPRPVWRDADGEDRKGVSEIKHINGLYAFWDELHRRFPDMMFENCASGGRRMDIEMMSRSHSYCRDDAAMSPNSDNLCQNITLNSTPYIPFTGGETFTVPVFDTYGWLSHMAAGTVFTPSDFSGMFLTRDPSKEEVAWFTKMLEVSDRVRPLFFGDFYAIARPEFENSGCYVGYQLDEKKSGEGFFIVFRREQCPEDNFELKLRDIDPASSYAVEAFDGTRTVMKGSDFARQELSFPEPRSFQMYFYKKL